MFLHERARRIDRTKQTTRQASAAASHTHANREYTNEEGEQSATGCHEWINGVFNACGGAPKTRRFGLWRCEAGDCAIMDANTSAGATIEIGSGD